MLKYTIRRLLLLIPTLFFVALIVFSLAHAAPGSPFDAKSNENKPLPQATIERLNHLYGIDKPVWEQFALYLSNAIRFDFGSSFVRDRPVIEIIGQGFPYSAQLGVQALLVALMFSLPLGVISALRQNSIVDYASLLFATVGTTIPSFVIGIFAIYIFGVTLHLLPFVGWSTPSHWILPTAILSLGAMAFLTRITRASMLEAIRQDYVRTARSKGLGEQVVIVAHVMKIVGPATAGLITGSIIIEGLFSIPGIGRLFLTSIIQRDYPLIMGTYMLYAVLIAVANLVVDLTYGIVDPRIRFDR